MAGMGHLKRICKDAFSVAGAVQKTCSWETLGGQGTDFLRGVAWQVQHFVWPGISFSWQALHLRQVKWKNRKTHSYEAISSALNFPYFKEVSQNCFVFDAVKFEKWWSLKELFRFGWCQVQKLRKCRKNSCVFKLADRQTDRQTDR